MTDESFAAVNGVCATKVMLHVPPRGPWFADCDLDAEIAPVGRVTLTLGTLALSGTVVPEQSGTFGLAARVRIVAGAGGWGNLVPAKDYHNDARVRSRNVAEDAARAVGETLGTFDGPDRGRADYVREAGPAAQALEDVSGGVPWWVDLQGVTHVAARRPFTPPPGSYEVLAYDARARVAQLAVDDLTQIGVGAVLTDRLDAPETVREFTVEVTASKLVVHAWCGTNPSGESRVAGALRAIIEKVMGESLFGKYRYRVTRMAGDRVHLQAVRKAAGLPDLLYIPMVPGVPGAHAKRLKEGGIVYVEFIEGDRSEPRITGFASVGEPGFAPEMVLLGTDDEAEAAEVAFKDAEVLILLPPFVFNGTIDGVPMAGVMVAPVAQTLGRITNGSPNTKVKKPT